MGRVFRLTWQLNLLLYCFGLSELYLATPDLARWWLASLHRCTVSVSFYIWSWRVGSTLTEDALPPTPPFSYLGMINLWGPAFFTVSYKKKFQLMTGGNFNLETILTEICLKSHFRPFFLFAASDKKFLLEPVLRLQTFWARSRYD